LQILAIPRGLAPFPPSATSAAQNSPAGQDAALVGNTYSSNYNCRMKIEWDADKAALNLRKHGIAFEDAQFVFLDPGRIESYDGREDYGEDRWTTIGFAPAGWPLLYVIYTVRDEEAIRLISARKANTHEQKNYRDANH
jgi:uncharacterized DUF497 family protein